MSVPELDSLKQPNEYNIRSGDVIIVKNNFRMEVDSLTDNGVKIKHNTNTFWVPFGLINYVIKKSDAESE